jgi:hypothetical protein
MLDAKRPRAKAVRERWQIPRKGDRIELVLPRLGVSSRGTVYYVGDLQILVKWDDGRSQNLHPNLARRFRIIERVGDAAAARS